MTLQPTTSSFANANLSVPSSDVALDGTAGELDRADTSRSPSLTKVLPLPSSMSFTIMGLFIRKDRKPPTAHYRALIDQFFIHDNASSITSQVPPPKDLPLYLPPHLPTNGVKQVNTRATLLLGLMSFEAMLENRD